MDAKFIPMEMSTSAGSLKIKSMEKVLSFGSVAKRNEWDVLVCHNIYIIQYYIYT